MQKYHACKEDLITQFKEVTFHYLPRDRNRFADVLATLASLVEILEGKAIKPFKVGRKEIPAYYCEIEPEPMPINEPWYSQIYQYLKNGETAFMNEEGKCKERIKSKSIVALKCLASHFVILGDILYKKHYQGPLLLYISKEKVSPVTF